MHSSSTLTASIHPLQQNTNLVKDSTDSEFDR